jgi:hypothetical protein
MADRSDPDLPEALLRLEVGRLRRRETRRTFDSALYVGTLDGERDSFTLPLRDAPAIDAGVRTDVVCTLLERTDPALRTLWLVRPGDPEPHDADLAWAGAARRAFALHERPLDGCYVITRYGWLDLDSGRSRAWKRLRI